MIDELTTAELRESRRTRRIRHGDSRVLTEDEQELLVLGWLNSSERSEAPPDIKVFLLRQVVNFGHFAYFAQADARIRALRSELDDGNPGMAVLEREFALWRQAVAERCCRRRRRACYWLCALSLLVVWGLMLGRGIFGWGVTFGGLVLIYETVVLYRGIEPEGNWIPTSRTWS